MPIGCGSTVKAFEFPLLLCVLNQPLPSLQPLNKFVRCVCVEALLVFILVAVFFDLYALLKGSSRKIHFPSGRTVADIDLLGINEAFGSQVSSTGKPKSTGGVLF